LGHILIGRDLQPARSHIETAKINAIDPEAYLRAVIARIADHPNKRIGQLLSWNITL